MKAHTLLMSALVIALASCSPAHDAPDGPIEIVYWRTLSGAAGDAQDEIVARFNASQSDVRVRAEYQGTYSDLATKLITATAARSGPDLAQLGTFEIRQFARSGALVDLSPFLNGPNGIDRSQWPKTFSDAGSVDGGVYWLPLNVAVPVLYYNADALTDAAIAAPPQTWDDFFAAARKLTKRKPDGTVHRAGVALWNITWPLFSMVWSEGGEFTSPDYQRITLDDPVIVRLMTELQNLIREGAATMPDRASGGHRGAFINGRAAMILDSQDALSEVFSNPLGFTPKIASYPAGAKGKVFAPGGGGIAMPAVAPENRRHAAWSFVRFMLAPEQLAYYARKSGYLAYTDAARNAMGDALNDSKFSVLYDALPHIRADFSVNMSPAIRGALDEAFQKILIDNADVRQTLEAADAKAEQAIAAELNR